MTPAETVLASTLKRTLKPRTKLNTHEWAAQHVRLDSRFTHRPGLYDVSYTPYMRGPHEWFSDPHVREITGCKSRQVGGTTWEANCMMYAVGEDPGPVLYVTSTGDNAQSFSEREWQPRVELSELLTALKPDDPDDFKKKEQHFKSCTVKFTGSNSAANLMSRAIRWLFEDEIDTWPQETEDQAPSLDIVEACTLSYGYKRKIVRVSTPTLETGPIWVYFKRGSMHKYYVPCPHCQEKFELLLEHLDFHRAECRSEDGVWDLDKVERLTTLKCPHALCGKEIRQHQQSEMVQRGEWRQTNFKAPREHISWHISALYSPTISWGQIAKIFLQKHETPGGLHDFYNHYLGLPFIRRTTSITVSDIEMVQQNSPGYLLYNGPDWKAPVEFELGLMAVDVQQQGFWWGQRGMALDEASYLIDYGQASSWEDLIELFDRQIILPSGKKMGFYRALIDSGWMAKRVAGVYDFCMGSGGRFMPVQGRSVVHGMFQPIRETVFEHRGTFINGVQIRDDIFKEELYIRRIKERVGPGWFLPKMLDDYYKKQLTDEQLRAKKTPRGVIQEWTDTGNNHLGDVEKYLLGEIHLVSSYLRELRGAAAEKKEPTCLAKIMIEEATGDAAVPKTPRESLQQRRFAPGQSIES